MATEKRLIDAIALLRKKYEIYEMGDPEVLFSQDFIHKVVSVEDVKNAPTVDAVEVVHGRWIPQYPTSAFIGHCSVCKTLASLDWNYCPNCGAKMDGDGNG